MAVTRGLRVNSETLWEGGPMPTCEIRTSGMSVPHFEWSFSIC